MASEILSALARMNLAAAAAIVIVLLLRRPVRAWCGARTAYALWLIAPIAALASLLPAPAIDASAGAGPSAFGEAWSAALAALMQAPQALTLIWAAGAALTLGFLAWRQHRFVAALGALHEEVEDEVSVYRSDQGAAGPALVGALWPRIVLPADFEARFDDEERALILAHERTHLAAGDAQINALVAVLTCVFWFNPFVHFAAFRLRLDQELACDADVVARYPRERRRYAETLLKTQLSARAIPLGCAWPPRGAHPLRERIAVLGQAAPGWARRAIGAGLVAGLCLVGGASAWSAQPARPAAAVTTLPSAEFIAGSDPASIEGAAEAFEMDGVIITELVSASSRPRWRAREPQDECEAPAEAPRVSQAPQSRRYAMNGTFGASAH